MGTIWVDTYHVRRPFTVCVGGTVVLLVHLDVHSGVHGEWR
jgi:hypothetical protein